MTKNGMPFFRLEERKELQPEYLFGEKIYKHIRRYAGFQHVGISDKNSVSAFKAIWLAFMNFSDECRAEIAKDRKRQPFQYLSAYDMPIALMPDGSQIICSNKLPQNLLNNSLFFLWIEKEGICHV